MEKHLQYPGLCFPVHPSDRTGVHSNPDVVSLPSQSLLSSRSDPELTKIPSFPRDLQEGGRAPAAPGVPDHGASGDLCQQVQERQMGSGWTRECTKSTQKMPPVLPKIPQSCSDFSLGSRSRSPDPTWAGVREVFPPGFGRAGVGCAPSWREFQG